MVPQWQAASISVSSFACIVKLPSSAEGSFATHLTSKTESEKRNELAPPHSITSSAAAPGLIFKQIRKARKRN
jgi:hypothetical protein